MTNKYILLLNPFFSMSISSYAMKGIKMVRTVPNTHFCCLYVKKIDEVIKIYQNCRVIQYSYTIFGSDAFIRHTILIFSPQNTKSRAVTHVGCKLLDQSRQTLRYIKPNILHMLLLQSDPK